MRYSTRLVPVEGGGWVSKYFQAGKFSRKNLEVQYPLNFN